MRKILLPFLLVCPCLLWSANDTITLDLSSVMNNYPQTPDGYWEDTYIDGAIDAGLFHLAHTGSSDGGGGMAYWEGYTLCTSGDTTDYGSEGSSDGWISKQWGCMAGGGADANGKSVPGAPYLVAYWGFFMESMDDTYHSLRIDFSDNKAHKAVGVWICNHPWPYYGNINGDGFADGFSTEGDYFALIAHGLNEQGEPTGGSVRMDLATFHDGALHQSKEWQYMDLSSLGMISGLYFTMETSDADEIYGANTAVYFCLDRLSVLGESSPEPLHRPTGLHAEAIGEDSVLLAWDSVDGASAYRLWLNDSVAGESSDTCFTFRALQAYTEYCFSVAATNATDTSELASLTCRTIDATAPSMPEELIAVPDTYSIALTWKAASDNIGILRYTVYVDDQPYRRTTDTACTIVGLEPETEYRIEVEAEDESANKSLRAGINVTTLAATTALPLTEDGCILRVYNLQGLYIGTQIPTEKGIYIIKTNNQITKISNY